MEKFVQIRLAKCCKVAYLFWMVPERFSNFSSFTTQKKALVPRHCSKLSLKSAENITQPKLRFATASKAPINLKYQHVIEKCCYGLLKF